MTSLRMDMSTYQRLIYTKQMPIKEKNPLTYLLKENQLVSSYSPVLESLFLNKKPEFVGSMDENLDWTHGDVSAKNKNARVSIVIKGGNAELLKESAKRLPTSTRIATAPSSLHGVIVNGWVLHSRDPIQANDLVVLDEIERSYRANLVSEMTDDLDDNLFTSLCAFLGTTKRRQSSATDYGPLTFHNGTLFKDAPLRVRNVRTQLYHSLMEYHSNANSNTGTCHCEPSLGSGTESISDIESSVKHIQGSYCCDDNIESSTSSR